MFWIILIIMLLADYGLTLLWMFGSINWVIMSIGMLITGIIAVYISCKVCEE